MAQEGLQIQIGADIVQVTQSLEALETEFKNLGNSLRQATPGSAEFARLSQEFNKQAAVIARVNAESRALGTGLSKNLTQGANQANTALVNLGRVVQDAPFGLIGIANNIDPLLSSFQQLQQQTGSTSSAFRALAGSLLGPAGIAIAVSAVTSAFIAFGPEISAALSGVSKFEQALRGVGEEGAKAASLASSEFNKLFGIINSSTSSAERQEAALRQINGALAQYGIEISTVEDFQRTAVQAGTLYTQIKQEEARATALAAKAAEAYAKQVAIGIKLQQGDNLGLFGDLSLVDQFNTLFSAGRTQAQLLAGVAAAAGKAAQEEKLFNEELQNSNNRINSLRDSLLSLPGVKEQFGKSVNESTKNVRANKTAVQELTDSYRELTFTVNQITENPALRQRQAISDAFQLPKKAQFSESFKLLEQYRILAEASFASANARAQELSNTIGGFINPAIDQFFNALANNQDPFKALAQSAQRLVVELAAAVVKALILRAITAALTKGASEALPGGGISSGAGGPFGGGVIRADLLRIFFTNR